MLAALDDATVRQANELADLHAAARDLLARAEVLDELAGQAEGDRAADLAARAEAARQQAAEAARQAEAPGSSSPPAPRRGPTRCGGRRGRGWPSAEAEIDRATEAIKAFGGGYGVGAGPGGGAPLSTRQKLALAQQVAANPKLRQIAASSPGG